MISPEILRRFPFFTNLNDSQFRALAMTAEQETMQSGKILFEEGHPANNLYIMVQGCVDLFIKSEQPNRPDSRRDFFVGEINSGEIFGISAVLEPFIYSATARTTCGSTFIIFDGIAIRKMMSENQAFALSMVQQIARSLLQRLNESRVQLAAAWALEHYKES